MNPDDSRLLNKLYRRYVPVSIRRPIRKYAKAVVAAALGVPALVNALAPAYSDEVQIGVGIVLFAATVLGVRQVANRDYVVDDLF